MPELDESSSGSSWPTSGDNNTPAPPFQWTLKTKHEEDQEYLTRLEAKLKQIQLPDPKMRDPAQKSSVAEPSEIGSDSDSTSGTLENGDEHHITRIMDDDPGIHLLYDHSGDSPRSPSPTPPHPIVAVSPPDPADPAAIIPPNANAEPGNDLQLESEPASPLPRSRLVHFRSRVRIASTSHSAANHGSRSSSISESSSLSAPLRGPMEESILSRGAAGRIFGIGPVSAAHAAGKGIHPGESLSEMMSSEAASLWLNRRRPSSRGRTARHDRRRRAGSEEARSDPEGAADERTGLVKHPGVARYGATPQMSTTMVARVIDVDAELDRARRAARKTEEDVIFGPWPKRLMNWNWWLYKVEQLTCGLCADDPYAE
ncbi:unnamed protein product [Rhizoctonia solani]|uniref:Uncharacterized protein n=1 Tax=Rhizoctonia solani TaxID=456999 RepID=A0A8H3DJV1_9AGAM|nr:unnamed protein product [Rhizoctonia solani]CAE6526924.1 unnamed protein product [Rhizoctonia solani]